MPALGNPINPISAMTFNSRLTQRLLAGLPLFDLPGCSVGCRLEMGVAVTALAAPRDNDVLAVILEVPEHMAPVTIANDRAVRDLDDQILGVFPGAIGPLTMLSAVGSPVALAGEVRQVGETGGSLHDDMSASAAVSAVRAASRDVFLAPKAQAAITAVSPTHEDRHAIDEHGCIPPFRSDSGRSRSSTQPHDVTMSRERR